MNQVEVLPEEGHIPPSYSEEPEDRHYVIVLARNIADPGKVLVIHKDRPEWQKGRINLPGGHVEQGEPYPTAAVRELYEETGLGALAPPVYNGVIVGYQCQIHAFSVWVNEGVPLRPRKEESEVVEWIDWAVLKDDRRLIDNLKLVIPLCQKGVTGWEVHDFNDYTQGPGRIDVRVLI